MGKKRKNRKEDGGVKAKDEKTRPRKFPIVPVIIVLIAVVAFGIFAYSSSNDAGSSGKLTMTDMAALKGGENKPVLSPSLFRGRTAVAYSVAKAYRDVLDYMYCYCNCKQSIGHKSLLSCFVDNHAANCTICQDQAMYAKDLKDKGYDIPQIREAMDKKFWRPLR